MLHAEQHNGNRSFNLRAFDTHIAQHACPPSFSEFRLGNILSWSRSGLAEANLSQAASTVPAQCNLPQAAIMVAANAKVFLAEPASVPASCAICNAALSDVCNSHYDASEQARISHSI
jgi:hypothetical protein